MFSGCPTLSSSVQDPKVETLWYRDAPDQRRIVPSCVRRLLPRGIRPSEILVLSTKTLQHSCLKDGWASDIGADLVDFKPGHNDNGAVQFSTTSAFKGLESDAVILLDAVSGDRAFVCRRTLAQTSAV
jgi:hypothetical protein